MAKISPITRTAMASLLQTNLLSGDKHVPPAYTTLNELFQISQNGVIGDDENPSFGYYAIGNRGHTSSVVDDDDIIINLYKHQPSDAACWNHIPFVLREEANDLSADQRLNYGLRRVEQYNNKNYFAYYLKRVPVAQSPAKVQRTVITNGVANTTDYVYDSNNLNPKRPVTLPDEATTTAAEFLAVTKPVSVVFGDFDVAELLNVAVVKFGTESRAIISEIALCSGVDRTIPTTTGGGAPINFKEVLACQVLTFISTYRQMTIDNRGFTMDLELGATEPLLTASGLTESQMNDLVAQARSGLLSGINITSNT
jgi:hypothetical protein